MRISDWSSDVCSSDLAVAAGVERRVVRFEPFGDVVGVEQRNLGGAAQAVGAHQGDVHPADRQDARAAVGGGGDHADRRSRALTLVRFADISLSRRRERGGTRRSEEHTSELQSLMRISYAVFCLKKKNNKKQQST